MLAGPPDGRRRGSFDDETVLGADDPLELLTLDQVSAPLKRSRRALYRDIRAGRFRALKLGGSTRVRRVELERYVAVESSRASDIADSSRVDRQRSDIPKVSRTPAADMTNATIQPGALRGRSCRQSSHGMPTEARKPSASSNR
jgi:excisionase family DNA binding protein